jgi:hypothetical protein
MPNREHVNVYDGKHVVRPDGTSFTLGTPLVCVCGVTHRVLMLHPLGPKDHEPGATHHATCPYSDETFIVRLDA